MNWLYFSRCLISLIFLFIIAFTIILLLMTFVLCSIHLVPIIVFNNHISITFSLFSIVFSYISRFTNIKITCMYVFIKYVFIKFFFMLYSDVSKNCPFLLESLFCYRFAILLSSFLKNKIRILVVHWWVLCLHFFLFLYIY